MQSILREEMVSLSVILRIFSSSGGSFLAVSQGIVVGNVACLWRKGFAYGNVVFERNALVHIRSSREEVL